MRGYALRCAIDREPASSDRVFYTVASFDGFSRRLDDAYMFRTLPAKKKRLFKLFQFLDGKPVHFFPAHVSHLHKQVQKSLPEYAKRNITEFVDELDLLLGAGLLILHSDKEVKQAYDKMMNESRMLLEHYRREQAEREMHGPGAND